MLGAFVLIDAGCFLGLDISFYSQFFIVTVTRKSSQNQLTFHVSCFMFEARVSGVSRLL